MSNLSKHKILRSLCKVYFNNQHLKDDSIIRKITNSLSFSTILKETGLSEKKLTENLRYLIQNNEISRDGKEENKTSNMYSLTAAGIKSYYSKFYIHNTWFMNKSFIVSIISLLIAFGGLTINYAKNKNPSEKIQNLENRIIQLEKILISRK